jgi:signal transduction histidine kinase
MVVVGEIAAIYGGAAVLACTCFYGISRSDRTTSSTAVWVLMFFCAIMVLSIWLIGIVEDQVDVIGICIASLAMLGYFLFAMQTSRRLRFEVEHAANRELQEQKLAAIGKLAGGVAHDFNNALTGISGNLELYFEIDDPEERVELLKSAQASADRAARLVKQLLIYSRKTDMERQVFDAQVLIRDAADFQRRLLPANVSMSVAKNPRTMIYVDQNLMVAALINLAVNAVDAMPDGGLLALSADRVFLPDAKTCADGRRLPGGEYARLTVRDTGFGIPEDVLPRVLDPFFSTKPVGKGSGLGLSMVVDLVESHNGGLEIETSPAGTIVTIYLPIALQGNAASNQPEPRQHPQALAATNG